MSWETLNAYVDGELAPAEAAAVASTVARDPDIAARIATLAALRAVVTAVPQEQAPPFTTPSRRPNVRGAARRLAGLAAAVIVSAGLGFAVWLASPVSRPADPAAAVAAHRHWLAGREALPAGAVSLERAGARSGALPDLSAASLRLVRLETGLGEDERIFAGYAGPNGCRVGLWVSRATSAQTAEPVRSTTDGVTIRSWRSGDLGYAMLAIGIDEARLDLIAALAARSLGTDRPATREQVAALSDARAAGRPCTA